VPFAESVFSRMPSSVDAHGAATWSNSGYWGESRRPLASLAFIAPLLVVYEAGVLVLGPQAVRNGADLWLRQLLEMLGFGQYFLLPLATVCILLGWHHTTRQPWRLSSGVLFRMAIECLLLSLCLRSILQLQGSLFQSLAGPVENVRQATAMEPDVSGNLSGVVGFLGAGVYEELLFRLILLSLVAWTVRRLGAADRPSVVVAVLLTSLAFAAAHYVGPYGEPLDWHSFDFWFSFLFRFLAGVFFAVLFVYRGFGIAAGSHAGYDILVGVL